MFWAARGGVDVLACRAVSARCLFRRLSSANFVLSKDAGARVWNHHDRRGAAGSPLRACNFNWATVAASCRKRADRHLRSAPKSDMPDCPRQVRFTPDWTPISAAIRRATGREVAQRREGQACSSTPDQSAHPGLQPHCRYQCPSRFEQSASRRSQ
jgi:hypothetical protein